MKSIPSWKSKKKEYKNITRLVRKWLYSFAKPACETRDEFLASKALLLAFIESAVVRQVFGTDNVKRMLTFIRANVETHEPRFLFYQRCRRRHFDTATNTAHEGTNNGIKYCAAPVLPSQSLGVAARTLSQNGKISEQARALRYGQANDSSKLWSDLPTSNYLTPLGEGLLVEQWGERREYESVRYGDTLFQVRRAVPRPFKGPLPVFERVRTVEILIDHQMKCDCYQFERTGIPCRHLLHVLEVVVGDGFAGIGHHDVSVHWWQAYSLLGYVRLFF